MGEPVGTREARARAVEGGRRAPTAAATAVGAVSQGSRRWWGEWNHCAIAAIGEGYEISPINILPIKILPGLDGTCPCIYVALLWRSCFITLPTHELMGPPRPLQGYLRVGNQP